jgi:hypothetical protein
MNDWTVFVSRDSVRRRSSASERNCPPEQWGITLFANNNASEHCGFSPQHSSINLPRDYWYYVFSNNTDEHPTRSFAKIPNFSLSY